jgi:protein O-mannosyl-transferase
MKKKTNKSLKKETSKIAQETITKIPTKKSELFPFMDYKKEVLFLLALSFILYINSFWNGFVLDDTISVCENKFVQKGILGIGKIFSTDSMFGYVGYVNDLQGGRYRPFPLLVFAFEHHLWGNNPHLFHLVTILFWVATTFVIYNFLRKYIFKDRTDIAFITSFLFIIHPIHTEVVANIKSLDEILSLFFLMSSVTLLFNYLINKNIFLYIASILLFFIALFSKEYGLTFLFIIPLLLHFFTEIDIKRIFKIIIPFVITIVRSKLSYLSEIQQNNY